MPLICRTGGLYLLSGSITGMRRICLFILCFLFSVVPVSGPAAESVLMPAALDYATINKQLDKMAKSLSSNKATPAETVPMLDDLDGFYNQINQADISYRVREKWWRDSEKTTSIFLFRSVLYGRLTKRRQTLTDVLRRR